MRDFLGNLISVGDLVLFAGGQGYSGIGIREVLKVNPNSITVIERGYLYYKNMKCTKGTIRDVKEKCLILSDKQKDEFENKMYEKYGRKELCTTQNQP